MLRHYEHLKSIAALNALYGNIWLFSFVVGMPTISIWSGLLPFPIGTMNGWLLVLLIFMYALRSGGIWISFIMAARVHAKANEFMGGSRRKSIGAKGDYFRAQALLRH